MPKHYAPIHRGYSEPWSYVHPHIVDEKGRQVYHDPRNKERAAQCVSALQGRDPAALPGLEMAIKRAIHYGTPEELKRLRRQMAEFLQEQTR